MKQLIAIILATVLGAPASALATDYNTYCISSCTPFLPTNATILSLAVGLAQSSAAVVNDGIHVEYTAPTGPCPGGRFISFVVIDAPVTHSGDLAYEQTVCIKD